MVVIQTRAHKTKTGQMGVRQNHDIFCGREYQRILRRYQTRLPAAKKEREGEMTVYDAEAGKVAVISLSQFYVGENVHAREPEFFKDYPSARKEAERLHNEGYIVLICPVAEMLGRIT